MNQDNYDTLLIDIAIIKEQLFKQSKVINSIENDIKLLLMMDNNSIAENKDRKSSMRQLVDSLPNDAFLDKFENIESTYKDYTKMANDSLSDIEIKAFNAGQKGNTFIDENDNSQQQCNAKKNENSHLTSTTDAKIDYLPTPFDEWRECLSSTNVK